MWTVYGALTMAGTFSFSLPYVRPEEDNTDSSVVLTLESSGTSEEAAGASVAAVLQRMGISWLHPLAKPNGPWKLNRTAFASYFPFEDREWLAGEQILRPLFDTVEIFERRRPVLNFVIAPDGPLAWRYSAQSTSSAWVTVDRLAAKLHAALESGLGPDDFQELGLLCRDATIALARAVHRREHHPPMDIEPGPADAKRMLADYFASVLRDESPYYRKVSAAVFDLAVHLQHKSTAEFWDAAVAARATLALIDIVAVIDGRAQARK